MKEEKRGEGKGSKMMMKQNILYTYMYLYQP